MWLTWAKAPRQRSNEWMMEYANNPKANARIRYFQSEKPLAPASSIAVISSSVNTLIIAHQTPSGKRTVITLTNISRVQILLKVFLLCARPAAPFGHNVARQAANLLTWLLQRLLPWPRQIGFEMVPRLSSWQLRSLAHPQDLRDT